MWEANDRCCAARPRGRCGSSRARSRRPPGPAQSARRVARSRPARRRAPRPSPASGPRWDGCATPATIASNAVAVSTAQAHRAGRSRSARSGAPRRSRRARAPSSVRASRRRPRCRGDSGCRRPAPAAGPAAAGGWCRARCRRHRARAHRPRSVRLTGVTLESHSAASASPGLDDDAVLGSSRGNSDAPLVSRRRAAAGPTVRRPPPAGPRSGRASSAPSASHSGADVFGITALCSTATARSDSAAAYRIVASRARPVGVVLGHLPRRLLGDVAVDRADEVGDRGDRLADRHPVDRRVGGRRRPGESLLGQRLLGRAGRGCLRQHTVEVLAAPWRSRATPGCRDRWPARWCRPRSGAPTRSCRRTRTRSAR